MKRLKFNKKGVLVGGFIPRSAHDSLNLLILYHGTNKAKLIQDFLFQVLKEAPSEESMIKEISDRVFADWKKWYSVGDRKMEWLKYVEEVKASLIKKISITHVNAIVESIEKLHKEDGKVGKKKREA